MLECDAYDYKLKQFEFGFYCSDFVYFKQERPWQVSLLVAFCASNVGRK